MQIDNDLVAPRTLSGLRSPYFWGARRTFAEAQSYRQSADSKSRIILRKESNLLRSLQVVHGKLSQRT
jgi:hypothetical protein